MQKKKEQDVIDGIISGIMESLSLLGNNKLLREYLIYVYKTLILIILHCNFSFYDFISREKIKIKFYMILK